MYPLDFEEFCLANGVQESTIDMLRDRFTRNEPVSDSVHDTMMRLFQAYVVVGGMPDVVQRYVNTHDIAQIIALQSDLLALYRLDMAKYADDKDRTKIRSIFDAIPSQLDDKNRRFVLADLSKMLGRIVMPAASYGWRMPVWPCPATTSRSRFHYWRATATFGRMVGLPTFRCI